jgi:hypothetical protein
MARRARNVISRTPELYLRACELLDDGLYDPEVAAQLTEEFGQAISARTVGSFYKADYERVKVERLRRKDDAKEVRMIIDAARGSGATFSEAAADLLAKQFYDLLHSGEPLDGKTLTGVAKSVGKLRDLEIQELKLQMQRDKESAAQRIKDAAMDTSMTPEDLVNEVDKLMGIAR